MFKCKKKSVQYILLENVMYTFSRMPHLQSQIYNSNQAPHFRKTVKLLAKHSGSFGTVNEGLFTSL